MKDYYTTLGVSRSSSEEDIKKAYRRLAHKYHPDKPGGDEKKFKEINEAYQTLSHKEKRAQYDRYGKVFDGVPSGAGAGFDPAGFQWGFDTGDLHDFGDIFESFFEGAFGRRTRATYHHGSDIEAIQEITLEEAWSGIEREIVFRTLIQCSVCSGLGHERGSAFEACGNCNGKGEVRVERKTFFGNFSQVGACGHCEGRGQVPKSICKTCGGRGRVTGERKVRIEISPGIEDGQVIKIKGSGEAGERSSASGDLYIIVKIKPHRTFKRQKENLFMTKEIMVTDALLEKKIEITDIAGEKIHIVIPLGFGLREKLRVPGRGMPHFGPLSRGSTNRGDLYITFNLKTPKNISHRAKELLEKLDEELK